MIAGDDASHEVRRWDVFHTDACAVPSVATIYPSPRAGPRASAAGDIAGNQGTHEDHGLLACVNAASASTVARIGVENRYTIASGTRRIGPD
jgi:hypothetical protein